MNIKRYLKRLIMAILNQPAITYSLEKQYIIQTSEIKRFSQKIAIITGASGAIGGAIATRLAYEGAIVYLGGRNLSKLEMISKDLNSKGLYTYPCVIDVTDVQSIENATKNIIKKHNKIDILVNCAGGSTRDRCANLYEQDIEMIDRMIDTNLKGSMYCTKIIGNEMVKSKYGKIVNIASIIGEHGKPKFSDYAASKAGIIGYTKSCAQEFGKYNININCVSPGFIKRNNYTENELPYLLNSNFMNRIGTVEDIASAVAYLLSEEAVFITGQNLCVDGGRSLGLHGDT